MPLDSFKSIFLTNYNFKGFPTIFFKAAGSEEVKTYDSGRDFDSFKSYVDENAVNVDSIKDEL